jgi:hypothetical protein
MRKPRKPHQSQSVWRTVRRPIQKDVVEEFNNIVEDVEERSKRNAKRRREYLKTKKKKNK